MAKLRCIRIQMLLCSVAPSHLPSKRSSCSNKLKREVRLWLGGDDEAGLEGEGGSSLAIIVSQAFKNKANNEVALKAVTRHNKEPFSFLKIYSTTTYHTIRRLYPYSFSLAMKIELIKLTFFST